MRSLNLLEFGNSLVRRRQGANPRRKEDSRRTKKEKERGGMVWREYEKHEVKEGAIRAAKSGERERRLMMSRTRGGRRRREGTDGKKGRGKGRRERKNLIGTTGRGREKKILEEGIVVKSG